ncbi:DMT family transporter [Staphylococcus pettenkoferi]|uniref:DMT family transporter n=1 Tax=Staphylococcus pettenkoferi TaxID=170573 RepID=UPI0002432B9F|nr:DMT family transporter [Staphylococcus pettenkoferi]ASE37218.1 EamA/RhaT family transporter [Staphylococcus pettenkoferi]EHM69182.1 EamA-like transporter family protein [Staphylococcus pettenkoferi VCU012]MCY1581075.1 DMT family transporter [Staphylococcus pettenkoferi]MCY1619277.1 DMT family transporter [Staphylococcus pettenkoferi]
MKKFGLLALLSLIWGSQFLFTAVIAHDASATFIAFGKAILGGIFLTIVTMLMQKGNYRKQWLLYIFIALFEVVLPFIFIAQGQRHVSSGISSVIMALMPVFTLLIMFIATSKKLNLFETIAIILGFIGVVFISWDPQHFDYDSILSLVLLVSATFCFAISLVLMQRLKDPAPLHHMRNVLYIASGMLLILLIIVPHAFTFDFNGGQWISLIILGIVHSALAYVIYNTLVNLYSPIFASLANYMVPVVGLLLGLIFLHEHLSVNAIIGIVVVFVSLVLSQKQSA